MKTMAPDDVPTIAIANHSNSSGSPWLLKEKLLLGLTPRQYGKLLLNNPLNWWLGMILAVGIPLLAQRYLFGLAAVTHASQDYPWGIFLGFGLFGMVPLSASGFLLSTAVEIFDRKDFHPIERLALLNGLLGYFFAVIYLLVDLGMPWRLAYPMLVSFGPAAVLFLVAWHVATYLTVQVAEIVPAFVLAHFVDRHDVWMIQVGRRLGEAEGNEDHALGHVPVSPDLEGDLAAPGRVELTVFDLRGRQVRSWNSGSVAIGSHDYHWNGRDASGRDAPSGLYFIRLRSGEFQTTRPLVLSR